MIPVDAILFDLDGTLIDSRRDLADSVRHLQARFGRVPSPDAAVAGWIGDGVRKLVERSLPALKAGDLAGAVGKFKTHYHRHCLDHTRLYPGARATLAHYRDKALAVVTNKPERVTRRILAGLGIASYFRLVVGGDSLRVKKPDPKPVVWALRALGNIAPRRAVMVGDGPQDVKAGRAAGVWTAGLRSLISQDRCARGPQADFELLNMRELMRIFS